MLLPDWTRHTLRWLVRRLHDLHGPAAWIASLDGGALIETVASAPVYAGVGKGPGIVDALVIVGLVATLYLHFGRRRR